MGEATNEIRAEIADTRERIAETAGAVGHKVDVPERVKETVVDTADAVKERVTDLAGGVAKATSTAGSAVGDGWRRAVSSAREEPIAAFLGGAAVGLMLGLVIPLTRTESEKLAPAANELKDRAAEAGQRALDRGAEMADRAVEKATETVERIGAPEGAASGLMPTPPPAPGGDEPTAVQPPPAAGAPGLPGRPMRAPDFAANK